MPANTTQQDLDNLQRAAKGVRGVGRSGSGAYQRASSATEEDRTLADRLYNAYSAIDSANAAVRGGYRLYKNLPSYRRSAKNLYRTGYNRLYYPIKPLLETPETRRESVKAMSEMSAAISRMSPAQRQALYELVQEVRGKEQDQVGKIPKPVHALFDYSNYLWPEWYARKATASALKESLPLVTGPKQLLRSGQITPEQLKALSWGARNVDPVKAKYLYDQVKQHKKNPLYQTGFASGGVASGLKLGDTAIRRAMGLSATGSPHSYLLRASGPTAAGKLSSQLGGFGNAATSAYLAYALPKAYYEAINTQDLLGPGTNTIKQNLQQWMHDPNVSTASKIPFVQYGTRDWWGEALPASKWAISGLGRRLARLGGRIKNKIAPRKTQSELIRRHISKMTGTPQRVLRK